MKNNEDFRNLGEWFNKNKWPVIATILLTIVIGLVFDTVERKMSEPQSVTYREYIQTLQKGMDKLDKDGKVIEEVPDLIDTVYYDGASDYWRYTLFNDDSRAKYEEWIASGKNAADFTYKYSKEDWRIFEMPDYTEDSLQAHVEKYDGLGCREIVKKSFAPFYTPMLPAVGATLMMFAFVFILLGFYAKKMSEMGGIGKDLLVKDTGIRFKDVIGHDEVITDLQLIVALMKASREKAARKKAIVPSKEKTAMERFDAEIPRGMLFSGEPGTGKTLLAKAIAGEAGVPFLYMNASGFVEMYVGVGAKRVRELFRTARKNAPCIIFIDEIDAVGTDRSATVSSEQKQTINALLQEMDGFDPRAGIFIIAATNNPDTLDKALVRSGRFDRQVIINPPRDYTVRKQMFELYLQNDMQNADLEHIAKQCIGFTGADINAVCNEARLIAITQDAEQITTEILEEAVDRKLFKGNRTEKKVVTDDLKVVAHHEAGHALVSILLNVPVSRATIIGNTGGTGGAVFREEEQRKLTSKKDMENSIMIAFGGRAAEEVMFGKENVTTGASSDILQATTILKAYISSYGFDDHTGLLALPVLYEEKLLNEQVNGRAKELSEALYAKTAKLLSDNTKQLEALAAALLEHETLTGEEIKSILEGVQ